MAYVHTITTRRRMYEGNWAVRIVWFLFGVVEVILLFRFALKLLGANIGASFTQFVYSISSPFVAPFQFIVPSPQAVTGIFEWSTLIALVVYWLVAYGIASIFYALDTPSERVETEDVREVRNNML